MDKTSRPAGEAEDEMQLAQKRNKDDADRFPRLLLDCIAKAFRFRPANIRTTETIVTHLLLLVPSVADAPERLQMLFDALCPILDGVIANIVQQSASDEDEEKILESL